MISKSWLFTTNTKSYCFWNANCSNESVQGVTRAHHPLPEGHRVQDEGREVTSRHLFVNHHWPSEVKDDEHAQLGQADSWEQKPRVDLDLTQADLVGFL